MASKDYTLILSTHFLDSEWTLNGDDYEGLIWLSDTTKPTKKQLDDLWQSTLAAVEKKKSDQIAARQAVLDRLGITADEAALLLS
jgi:hypothetical protein